MKGCVYFHQGWTDIINCLPIVNYYTNKYEKILLIIREDAKDIIDFYTKNIGNIKIIYRNKSLLDNNIGEVLKEIPKDYEYLFHGYLDFLRKDIYQNSFNRNIFYAEGFYNFYGIPFNKKIDLFNFERDFNIENKEYLYFINTYGTNYTLYHINDEISIFNKEDDTYIDINGLSNNMFSFLKILENAKEIHLMDSIWASFCYLIDSKFKLFNNIKIYLYPFNERSGGLIEDKNQSELIPINLRNWIIKNI